MKLLFVRALIVWIGLCFLAFINGAFREIFLKKKLKIVEPYANQISCVSGILLWTLFVYWYWPFLKIKNLNESLYVGLGWLILTFLFETFILDRRLTSLQIIETYNIKKGQYWGIVLLWITILPIIYFILKVHQSNFS